MKKIILFILTLLIGSMQPVMAMEQAFGPGLEDTLRNTAPANTTVNIGVAVNPQPTTDMQRNQIMLGALVGEVGLRQARVADNQQVLETSQNTLRARLSDLTNNVVEHRQAVRNNKRAYAEAEAKAKIDGRTHGMLGGVFSGLGYVSVLAGLLSSPFNISLPDAVKFTAAQSVSYYKSREVKKEYYHSLRANEAITPNQKIKLKKTYHAEEFKANTVTTAATAVGITAACLGIAYAVNGQESTAQSVATSFWNYLPHTVLGITALKWLTYTGMRSYKKWMRGDQPPHRRQEPYLRAQVP